MNEKAIKSDIKRAKRYLNDSKIHLHRNCQPGDALIELGKAIKALHSAKVGLDSKEATVYKI